MADARTTVTLLHLRDIERRAGKKVPITSEILDIQNRDLARGRRGRRLHRQQHARVADGLAARREPATSSTCSTSCSRRVATSSTSSRRLDYVEAGEVTFATVREAALRRDEIAIGYRFAARARDPQASYGVVVSPAKRDVAKLGPGDKVIVLAED